jgi:N-acetylglucosaminyldiphosphoundecaprenol N-acetyl-beta-D-mannosaminyltransferase
MGLGVTPFESYAHAVSAVHQRIKSREKTFIAAVNPEKIYVAHRDDEIRNILMGADFLICDGIGAAMAAKTLHGLSIPRITGISLFFQLINAAAQSGHSVYLLGGSDKANALACDKLRADYPRLNIVGNHHGYFEDSEAIVDAINLKGPDMLFVALGSPKQEIWIAENRHRIDAPICMGIGGTLDVVGGTVKWAPALFRKTGTEWLYRLISEPSRWKRQLALPRFVMLLAKYRFGRVN